MNKNAIFFTLDNEYVPSLVVVLMGLHKHSPELMKTVDVIVYDSGISEESKTLLQQLHPGISYRIAEYPPSYTELLQHNKSVQWGNGTIINKLFGFDLVRQYEKVLFLDTDMLIMDDISQLFETEEDMAWRNVIAWNAADYFRGIINEGDRLTTGNGGMLLFTDRLNKYNISHDDIAAAFQQIKEIDVSGNDELILTYIVYKYKIKVREMDIKIWNTPVQMLTKDTKLLHFLNYHKISTKPWINLASYYYFDEWTDNYEKWLQMGGHNIVEFSDDQKWELFSFDKLRKIARLRKDKASLEAENRQLKAALDSLKKNETALEYENRQLREELNRLKSSKLITMWASYTRNIKNRKKK